MWIFTKDALLMPAAVPPEADRRFTHAGKFDLQIRGRDLKQLVAYRKKFAMGEASLVQSTPEMDYQFRFYTTRESFALVLAADVLEIDYLKFKPEATCPEYHGLLNRIWHVVYQWKSESRA